MDEAAKLAELVGEDVAETRGPTSPRCVECGRAVVASAALAAPRAAKLVCDAHVEVDTLLARRRSSSLRMLAQRHGGIVAVVPTEPTTETER